MRILSLLLRIITGIILLLSGAFLLLLLVFSRGHFTIIPVVQCVVLIISAIVLLMNKWRLFPFLMVSYLVSYIIVTIYRYFSISHHSLTSADAANIPFYFIPILIIGLIWYIEKSLSAKTQKAQFLEIPENMYAGLVTRFIAYTIDGLFFGIPALILVFLLFIVRLFIFKNITTDDFIKELNGGWINLFLLVISFSYFIYFTKKSGATPGKKYLHIKVISSDGGNLTLFQIIVRETLGRILSGIFYIGYILIIFSKKKKGLHDLIAGTSVVSDNFIPSKTKVLPIKNT